MDLDSPLPLIGRPRSAAAVSHAAIMDAVHELLKTVPARDLTIGAVAKKAKVGKPTLYKWWPSKAALILAMFHERFSTQLEVPANLGFEAALRFKMQRLVKEMSGVFGKVVADLIAEGQGDGKVLEELYASHVRPRRGSTIADIERGKEEGELLPDTNADLLLDSIVGPLYYRLLLRAGPLTPHYVDQLIDQALLGVRRRSAVRPRKKVKPSGPKT